MGLAQTFLTIAAIALLGVLSLTLNTSYLTTNQTMVESEFTVEAVSLGESYLERAVGKSYDENSISGAVSQTKDFSSSLGKDVGESVLKDFDDFDDFNGFNQPDTTERSIYNISIKVVYVNDSDLNTTSVNQTWHKKMTITVSNAYMSTPVEIQYIYSYF